MSAIQSVRVRSQRSAAAAVERARLTVVAARPSTAPRAPFAVLVFLILGAGVVGLLMFNTQMQQASIHATELQAKVDRLQARSEALNLAVANKRDPQEVAKAARLIGMVSPPVPAVIDLRNRRILGTPTPARPGDGTRVKPFATRLPGTLNPKPLVIKVKADAKPAGTTAGQTAGGTGAASTGSGSAAGTNGGQNKPSQGAPR